MGRLLAAAMALCGCQVQTVAPTPTTFDVRLHHTAHVGDGWRVVADGEASEASSTYTEQVVLKKSDKKEHVHWDARAVVREMDALFPKRIEYTLASFTRDGKPVLEAGTRVLVTTAAKREDALVEIDGRKASAEVRDAIDAAIPLTHGPGTEDMVFGSDQRQSIGGSWVINVAAMQVELGRNDVSATPDAVQGRATLVGIEPIVGVMCLHVHVEVRVEPFGLKKPLPDGSQVTRGRVVFRAEFFMPIDGAARRRDEIEVHTDFEAFIPTESAEVVGVTVEHHVGHHRTTTYER
jgi:hypothetical protein